MDEWLILSQAFATVAMTTVIVFVQWVHYPLFARVGEREFPAYEREHMRRISFIVMPLMVVELVSAALLWYLGGPWTTGWEAAVGFALVAVIWLSTALWQAPAHGRLAQGFDPALLAHLLRSNRVRTVAWCLRSLLVGLWLSRAVG